MVKQKTSKKKGPKGKKARAKAKLDRQWGESAIIDDEKPRRIGKSRLLARAKKDDERKSIRWASDDKDKREMESTPSVPQPRTEFSGVLKNKKPPTFHSKKSHNHDDDESFSNSEMDSENEDTPPLQGLLRTIRQSKTKTHVHTTNRRNVAQDLDEEEMNAEEISDAEMEDSDVEDDENDDEISIQDDDISDDEALEDGDSVDENGTTPDGKRAIDLFHQHFSRKPLDQDGLKNSSAETSKVTVNDNVELLLTLANSNDASDDPKFGSEIKPDDLQKIADSSFEGNRKILQHRWKRLNKNRNTLTEKQYPIYPFLTRYMDLLVTTDSRKVRIGREIECLSYFLTPLFLFTTTGSRRTPSALLVARTESCFDISKSCAKAQSTIKRARRKFSEGESAC